MTNRSLPLSRKDYRLLARKHVQEGYRWGQAMGTDYWLTFNSGFDEAAAAATGTTDELAEAGWTATSLVNTAGSGADFGSSSDKGVPNHLLTNATGDLLASPSIFGDYAHMHAAMRMVGASVLPTKLSMEFWGSMSVKTADEPRSGWGFFEDGATVSVEADQLAFISSDGTNFQIGSNAGTPVDLLAVDTSWHLFKVTLDVASGLVFAAIDGTDYLTAAGNPVSGVTTTLSITGDEFPCKIGFHALTTNRPLLGLTHVYYDWS